MSTDTREARLARRISDLYATDQQFADARPNEAVATALESSELRLPQIIQTVIDGYAHRPALGQRAVEFVTDAATGRTSAELLPRFDTVTYRELSDRVNSVAAALTHYPVQPGDRVAILGFTSMDYTTVDMALLRLGAVSVPLQTSAPVAQLRPIAAETEPVVIASSIDFLDDAVELMLTGHLPERLVVFDYHGEVDDHREALAAATTRLAETPVAIQTLADVLARGNDLPITSFFDSGDDATLALLIYTSGSTGTPKGEMYLRKAVTNSWRRSSMAMWGNEGGTPSITLNFMPMSHMMGRGILYATLGAGGTAYFVARSDLSTFFEDLALARPTQLSFVPRIWDMVFQEYQSEVDRRSADGSDRWAVEADVLADLRRNLLGGRFVSAMTGSAPISTDMKAFVESLLDIHLTDGYGSTEAGAVFVDGQVQRPPVIDYKLVDVPELGYFSTDRPHPRGELLVNSETLFPGYYKRPEVTADVFDADGYYRTGDVVAELGPDQVSGPPQQRAQALTGRVRHRRQARSRFRRQPVGPPDLRLRQQRPLVSAGRRGTHRGCSGPPGRGVAQAADHGVTAGRGEGSGPAVLRDSARLHHRDNAFHARERSAHRYPQARAAEAQGVLQRSARTALHRPGRQPGQRAAGTAPTGRRPTGTGDHQLGRRSAVGRGGRRPAARCSLHRPRWRFPVRVDIRQSATRDLRHRRARRRHRQPGKRPGIPGRLHRDRAPARRQAADVRVGARPRRDRGACRRPRAGQVHRRQDHCCGPVAAWSECGGAHGAVDRRDGIPRPVPGPGMAGADGHGRRQGDLPGARQGRRRCPRTAGQDVRQRRPRIVAPLP